MNKKVSVLIAMFLFFSCAGPERKTEEQKYSSQIIPLEMKGEPFIPELSSDLNEISGLMIWDNLYWGFNDSGGEPVLFGFDRNGAIQKKVEIGNAGNRDWESIAQDEHFIYVGDFGNNSGNRRNLCVYKIKKQDIGQEKQQGVNADEIKFHYAKQNQFNYNINTTPFDCEAMLELNGKLYLFSKNWQDKTTWIYQLPTSQGDYSLHALDTFNVNLLVTGADISPDKNKMALVGYLDYHAFIWIFSDFEGDDFFNGESSYISLPDLGAAQTEGICFAGNDSLLISCEAQGIIPQQVFLIDLKELKYGTHKNQ